MDREQALTLLRDQHQFPGPFTFRVVVYPDRKSMVLSAMLAAAGEDASLEEVTERPSRKGTYVALQVRVHLQTAEAVLEVYDVLKQIDGIFATL